MKLGQLHSAQLLAWPGQNEAKYAYFVLWLIVLTIIWRIWAAAMVGFGIGEAYYLASSRSLHLSYFDQPPLFLWVLWAINAITPGEAPVLLRLPFILMFSLSTWIMFQIGVRVQSARAGWLAALLLNISLLFQVSIGGWAQPEAPLMLFWLLTVWFLLDVFGEEPRAPLISWAWAGGMLGLTFLSKYHAIFLLYGAGLYTMIVPNARKWIVRPGPYIALAIAALIASPVLFWNWQNNFISFTFQGSRAFGDDVSLARLMRMIVGQLIYITPWIALPALAAAFIALKKGPQSCWPNAKENGIGFFIVMLAHGPIILFTAVAAWSETQFHFHWQAPGYMMLFLLLAMWMDTAWRKFKSALTVFLLAATLVNFATMLILITQTANGWLRQVIPAFEEGVDPTRDALPWTALANFLRHRITLEPGSFVAGVHWTECGHVDNAVAGQVPFLCLSPDPRNIAFNVDPKQLQHQTGYIATSDWPHIAMMEVFTPFFADFEQVGEVEIQRSGRTELPPVRIYRGDNLIIDREFGPTTTGKFLVPLLPLTRISHIMGQLDPQTALAQVNTFVDGDYIGAAKIVNGAFEIVTAMGAALPLRTAVVELKAPDGTAIATQSVRVKIGYLHQNATD